jgi:hypothetical protein
VRRSVSSLTRNGLYLTVSFVDGNSNSYSGTTNLGKGMITPNEIKFQYDYL